MNKIIFVLGMHRSFTSVFTNYLNDIGISMGTFENVVSKEENPEGFFENLSISAFNDKLLNRLNARWDSIIDLSNIDYNINDFDDLFTEARRLIEAQLAGGDTILVKDPRMCLVLPFWLKVIEFYELGTSYFIHIFRKPSEVVKSFESRYKLDNNIHFVGSVKEYVELLWLNYNVQAISFIKDYKFISIDGNAFTKNPDSVFDKINNYIDFKDLKTPEKEVVKSEHINNTLEVDEENSFIAEFYKDLINCGLDKNDEIRNSFINKYKSDILLSDYIKAYCKTTTKYRYQVTEKLNELISQNQQNTSLLEELKSEDERKKVYIEELKGNVNSLKAEDKRKEIYIEDLKSDINSLSEEDERKSVYIKSLKTDLVNAENEKQKISLVVEKLENQVSKKNDKIEKMSDDLEIKSNLLNELKIEVKEKDTAIYLLAKEKDLYHEHITNLRNSNLELMEQSRSIISIGILYRKIFTILYFIMLPFVFVKKLIKTLLKSGYRNTRRLYKEKGKFDVKYYLEQEKSIFINRFNALDNYILHGYKNRYNPNRSFNVNAYLKANLDVADAGVDAYAHFLSGGLEEGREVENLVGSVNFETNLLNKIRFCKYLYTNNLYDYQYYISNYSDRINKRSNKSFMRLLNNKLTYKLRKVLLHPVYDYVFYGVKEGADLVSNFNSLDYLYNNRDVLLHRINPYYHYTTIGRAEKRVVSRNPIFVDYFLEYNNLDTDVEEKTYNNIQKDYKIDIIIPVYNGREYLDVLFGSILENTTVDYRLIIIEDCSPDVTVKDKINEWIGKFKEVEFIENETNLGFVKSVNKASKYAENDFVIKNTHTTVPNNWVERLMKPIKEGKNVATVTPFSNAATYLSFPKICEDNTINQAEATLCDEIFREFVYDVEDENLNLPTGVGFCMAINHDLWVKLGGFDEEKFGLGYGEENDFCQRSVKNGFVNKFVPNLFVYHFHGGSFESEKKRQRIEESSKVISSLYPHYNEQVHKIILNPYMKKYTDLALMNYIKKSDVVLVFDHGAGGGASDYLYNNYVKELVENNRNYAIIIPRNKAIDKYIVEVNVLNKQFKIAFNSLEEVFDCFSKEVVINELVFWPQDELEYILKTITSKEYKTMHLFHDFYAVCPSYTLMTDESIYCDNCDIEKCKKCINKNRYNSVDDVDIVKWRKLWGDFILNSNVRFFSESIYKIGQKYYEFDESNVDIIPHKPLIEFETVKVRNVEKLTIGIVGGLNIQKGVLMILEMIKIINQEKLDIDVVVVGDVQIEYKAEIERFDNVRVLGRYKRDDLPKIIEENNINIVNIASVWPETFCYALQEIMQMELPVVSFDIGAQGERVSAYEKGSVASAITAEALLEASQFLFEKVKKKKLRR